MRSLDKISVSNIGKHHRFDSLYVEDTTLCKIEPNIYKIKFYTNLKAEVNYSELHNKIHFVIYFTEI